VNRRALAKTGLLAASLAAIILAPALAEALNSLPLFTETTPGTAIAWEGAKSKPYSA